MFDKFFFPVSSSLKRKIHELNTVFFELTNACNISCLPCGSDCKKSETPSELPLDKIIEVLKDIKEKYDSHKILIILSGGEPLLYSKLFELSAEITKLEFPWGMVSNGFAWTDEHFKKAKQTKLGSITISLDGLEPEHNWLRGHNDSFRKATKTIKKLVEDPFYQAMDVITCVNKKTVYKLDEIRNLLISLGVKDWRLFTISPIGRASSISELFLDSTEYKFMLDKVLAYKNKPEIKVDLSGCSYLGQNYELKIKKSRFFCQAGNNVAGIMVNGDILACPNIDRAFKQGNVFKDKFTNIWETKYKEYRNRNWMKVGICKDCSDWNFCFGGPLHLRDAETKKTKLCHIKEFKL